MEPWFDRAFGPGYESFYSHRDESDASRDVSRILAAGVDPHELTLDLCCGQGRHIEALARDGGFTRLVGLDRSSHLLQGARQRLGRGASLVRGDMRQLPFPTGTYHLVLNLFTSFGYFEDDADHRLSLQEVWRVLTVGGRLHLDHIDRRHLEEHLVASSRVELDGRLLRCTRRLTENRVEKRLEAEDGTHVHLERVRLWYPEELQALLESCGFSEVRISLDGGRMHAWTARA